MSSECNMPSELARYRILSPTAGVRVSPLCLGTLNFGRAWKAGLGASAVDTDAALACLDAFFALGGNFIDTANGYQAGSTERLVGHWLQSRGLREQVVLSTKFAMSAGGGEEAIRVNFAGNSVKSLRCSLTQSLEKLQTSYVDVLFVHYFDYTTSLSELMTALNDEVRAGRVHYLGICNTPAWIVSKANEYARSHGMAQFVAYQGEWSLLRRDLEREVIPMCRHEGMAILPYGVLGQGKFKTQKEVREREASGASLRSFWDGGRQTASERAVSEQLEAVAREAGAATLGEVALAYHLRRFPYVFPVIGCRTVEQLRANVRALSIELTAKQAGALEGAVPFVRGFPYDQFGMDPHCDNRVTSWMMAATGHCYEFVEHPKAIKAWVERDRSEDGPIASRRHEGDELKEPSRKGSGRP